jgi:Carboxyl transferase domain
VPDADHQQLGVVALHRRQQLVSGVNPDRLGELELDPAAVEPLLDVMDLTGLRKPRVGQRIAAGGIDHQQIRLPQFRGPRMTPTISRSDRGRPPQDRRHWAPNLQAACEVLFAHYDHAYVAPEERFPRRAETSDPADRDVRDFPHAHPSSDFTTVGDIFSASTNKDRKKPFDIRTVMRAVVDQDHPVLERWPDMADADTSVVFDAHIAGIPVCVIGIESRVIPRKGWVPADGPDQWTSGTLFPQSSKKTARAINAASGNRPLVVLANLSGFDGSPESLRNVQLENGAEIGRAIVNFDGPIVFCVVSRYHGGAFVVFSNALNENMEVLAVEGSFSSVIGGAPAAAVVFTREVNKRTAADPTVRELEAQVAASTDDAASARLRVKLAATRAAVRSDKLGEVAAEFEAVHNVERAPDGFGPLDHSGG